MKKILSLALLALTLNACSVGMAMSGKKDPDLSVVKVGADRQEVELQLGSPIKIASESKSLIAVYEYEIGNAPSAGRAIGHGVMDVLTLGGWEIIGTPIEGVTGDKYQVEVKYDQNSKVTNISRSSAAGN